MCKGRGSAPDDFNKQVEYLKSRFKLSEEKIIEYKAFFNEYSEKEKVIQRENFQKVYKILYRNDDATSFADRVFDAFDTNQDGTVDFVEFAGGLTMIDSKQMEQKISIAFSMFDEDGSNALTLAEVIAMMEVSVNDTANGLLNRLCQQIFYKSNSQCRGRSNSFIIVHDGLFGGLGVKYKCF